MKLSPAIVICDTMNLNGQMLLVFGTCQVFITDPAFISCVSVRVKLQCWNDFNHFLCHWPQSLQFTAWILQYVTQDLHSSVFYFISAQVQFSQVWKVQTQGWSQDETLFLCNTASTQTEDRKRKTMNQIHVKFVWVKCIMNKYHTAH